MDKSVRARVQTVPIGVDLSGALAGWLVQKFKDDRLALADVILLLPNNRAVSALTAAFVRSAQSGLVLPHMVAIGDLALDEKLGAFLDPLHQEGQTVLPAVPELERLLKLVELIRLHRREATAAEALHLAKQLIRTLDELEVEEKSIREIELGRENADLAEHWSTAYDSLKKLSGEYHDWLVQRGVMAPAARRNALLYDLEERLKSAPPASPIIAAGITTAAPAISRLLARIARLPTGLVLLPHVDLTMPDDDWNALGRFEKVAIDEGPSSQIPAQETHPQYHLKLLLHHMGVARDELEYFGKSPERTTHLVQAIRDIFCAADKTIEWQGLPLKRRTLDHVRIVEAEDSAIEARAIAILVREAIEVPGKRIAVITPDREIAKRVSAQLRRWNIEADDSAGEPLSTEPAGVLFLALSRMLAQELAPIPLLSVMKHPLVRSGDKRLEWLENVRSLDLALRGPQMRSGAGAIADLLAESKRVEPKLRQWWATVEAEIRPHVDRSKRNLRSHLNELTQLADLWTDGAIWKGPAGRQLAEFVEELSAQKLDALSSTELGAYPDLLADMLSEISMRPAYGRHPRVSIYGLLEARLQSADLVICAGLNEGIWPQLPQPDPWLAPHLRRKLEMPGLDRNIGLAAHDLASAFGASEVVITRAKRDRSGPTIASRFLLRLQALLGERLQLDNNVLHYAEALDRAEQANQNYIRPAPMPDAEQRKVGISITQMDMLKADPYAFYARNILKLEALKPVDADPDPAWKGTLVHDIIENWTKSGDRDPESLIRFATTALSDRSVAPALRLLWQPRIVAGLRWVASEIAANGSLGRSILKYEVKAKGQIAGVAVHGRIDRVDQCEDGSLVVVDYKTGSPPAKGKVKAGFALQLGLSGLLIESGAVEGVAGRVSDFEYWSLAKKNGSFGYREPPFARKAKDGELDASTFVKFSEERAGEAIAGWILGNAPFTAKLKPDYAIYKDYDQLMRLDEWIGRASWNEASDGE